MVQYEPIYTYQSTAPHTGLLRLLALLSFVAVSSVFFLSFTDYVYWRQNQPVNQALAAPDTQALGLDQNTTMASFLALDDFLVQAKQNAVDHLKAGSSSKDKLTIIMGNEAGDLDSAACAVALSYLLTRFGPPAHTKLDESSYVPLIQTDQADTVLRPENTAAFHASSIPPEHLFWLDDVQKTLNLSLDSDAFSSSSKVAIGLVDHPSLTGPWGGAKASNRQVDILVDHHEDSGDHTSAALRIIKSPSKDPVGSCASLITELFADRFARGERGDLGLRQIADLLISAIIIDTDNLRSAPRGKATKSDFEAVKTLFPASSFGNPATSEGIRETALSFSPLNETDHTSSAQIDPVQPISPSEDTDSATQSAKVILAPYWGILSQSKQAVSHLSGRDLLRRDYKEVDFTPSEASTPISLKLGFASVPISIAEWLHKDRPHPLLSDSPDPKAEVKQAWAAWWKVLDDFMAERKIDLAVMTGSFRVPQGEVDGGKHKRELVLAFAPRSLRASEAERVWDELRRGLESDAHTELDNAGQRLMLEEPWKGQRLPESAGGKKERVKGLDADGRREDGGARWAKVYKQANAKANRKIVLPAVTTILKMAVKKL